MATEKIKFKLELYSTFWRKAPHANIMINEKSYFDGDISSKEQMPTVVEFEHELEGDKDYKLIIERSGKNIIDTRVDAEGKIYRDQLLHIKAIEIDEIEIGALVYDGVYVPKYPEPWATQQIEKGVNLPSSVKNVKDLGHNGTWTFNFSSPFYMWLLENLY